MREAQCKRCGGSIIWSTTRNGKRMPVDAEPVEIGNVTLDEKLGDNGSEIYCRVFKLDQEGEVPAGIEPPYYTSHFDTCAHKDERPASGPSPAGLKLDPKLLPKVNQSCLAMGFTLNQLVDAAVRQFLGVD